MIPRDDDPRDALDDALDDLARALPDGDPGGESGAVRREVLFSVTRSRRRRALAWRVSTVAAFAMGGVVAAIVLLGLPARDEGAERVVTPAPGVTRITQGSGRVTYDVAPRGPGERFVVATPNAEVEVRGTRFTVGVEGAETTVDVDHGRVEVREPGGVLRAVLTGGQHTAVRRTAPPSVTASAASADPASIALATPPVAAPLPPLGAPLPPAAATHAPHGQAPRAHETGAGTNVEAQVPEDAELRLFRAAHELHFRQGDLDAAVHAWDRYLAAYPHGALTEEARYNRAVCLLRLGRNAEADLDALASTPGAFRAREAKLLQAASLRREGRCTEAERLLAPLRQGTDDIAHRAAALAPCAGDP